MKPSIFRLFTGLCAATLLTTAARADDLATNLPFVVPIELGDQQFAAGDSITILRVTGTQDTIIPGGTYSVDGQYTLASHDDADLAMFMTVSDETPSPIQPQQETRVKRGSGVFHLVRKVDENGYLHLSFYPSDGGSDFGGVHFGQGKWVLHNGDYSQLRGHTGSPLPPGPRTTGKDLISMCPANLAMLEYLGSPIDAPKNLAAGYTPAGLKQAVQTAAQQADISPAKIEIEDSEFPALVGVICSRDEYARLMTQIRSMKSYADQGSVGSPRCQAMNIVPWSAFPSGAGDQIERRLSLREQMFYDKLSRGE